MVLWQGLHPIWGSGHLKAIIDETCVWALGGQWWYVSFLVCDPEAFSAPFSGIPGPALSGKRTEGTGRKAVAFLPELEQKMFFSEKYQYFKL